MQTTNLRDLKLTPRAVAVLVALRKGPRGTASLADALADDERTETRKLLDLLNTGIDGERRGARLIRRMTTDPTARTTWGLTYDGLGWLQSHGLDASENAKQALYKSIDAQPVVLP